MAFKAVIFDMDGTLIDSLDDICYSMNHVLHQNNLPIHSKEIYKSFIGNGIENLVRKAIPEHERSEERILYYLKQMKDYYSQHWMDRSSLFPGIAEMLTRMKKKGIKLALLSNKPDKAARIIGEKLLGSWNFDIIMGNRDEFPLKPDPSASLYIAGELGLQSNDIVFVGDSYVDMKTALHAGMYPLAVSWGYSAADLLKNAGAAKIIDSPDELDAIIH
jgi:phosphoglycolate phosphatase